MRHTQLFIYKKCLFLIGTLSLRQGIKMSFVYSFGHMESMRYCVICLIILHIFSDLDFHQHAFIHIVKSIIGNNMDKGSQALSLVYWLCIYKVTYLCPKKWLLNNAWDKLNGRVKNQIHDKMKTFLKREDLRRRYRSINCISRVCLLGLVYYFVSTKCLVCCALNDFAACNVIE